MRAQTAASAPLTLTLTYPLTSASDLALPTALPAAVTTAVKSAAAAAAVKQMRLGWGCEYAAAAVRGNARHCSAAVTLWWGLG